MCRYLYTNAREAGKKGTKMLDITVTEGKALTGKARKAFDQFVIAQQMLTEGKKLKAEAEAILIAHLGDATIGMIGKHIALKVVASKNTSFDRETLKSSFPEAYSTCLKETSYTYLKAVH
jgi:hypothetical protein